MNWVTADLSDDHPEVAVVNTDRFRHFGQKMSFCGPIRTVQAYEDNALVKATLETPGEGAVLVVDGGGSTRCALVGDVLAQLAIENDWAGIVLWAAVRDSAVVNTMEVGIKAIATSIEFCGFHLRTIWVTATTKITTTSGLIHGIATSGRGFMHGTAITGTRARRCR